jgi:hypothetical protein
MKKTKGNLPTTAATKKLHKIATTYMGMNRTIACSGDSNRYS